MPDVAFQPTPTGKANISTTIFLAHPNPPHTAPALLPSGPSTVPASLCVCDLLGLLGFWSKRKKSQRKKANRKKMLQIILIRTKITQKIKHLSYCVVKPNSSLWCTVKEQLCLLMDVCKLLSSHPVENSESFTADTARTPCMTPFSTGIYTPVMQHQPLKCTDAAITNWFCLKSIYYFTTSFLLLAFCTRPH